MAKKKSKFESMESSILEALLDDVNTSDADALVIENILNEREKDQEVDEYFEEEPEELQESQEKTPRDVANAERREEILVEMRAKIGFKAEIVPFNTIEWVSGYISGILDDPRAKLPMWVVKSNEGQTIRKVYGSPLIKVSDEKHPHANIRRVAQSKPKLTEAEVQEVMLTMQTNLGKVFEHPKWGESTVIGVSHDKRHNTLMYSCKDSTDKKFNCVYTNVAEFTGEDAEVRERNQARISYAEEMLADPNAAVKFKEAEIETLETQLARLQERLAAAKAAIADFE